MIELIDKREIVRMEDLIVGEFYVLDYSEVDPDSKWIMNSSLQGTVIEYSGHKNLVVNGVDLGKMYPYGKVFMLANPENGLSFDNGPDKIMIKIGDEVILPYSKTKFIKL